MLKFFRVLIIIFWIYLKVIFLPLFCYFGVLVQVSGVGLDSENIYSGLWFNNCYWLPEWLVKYVIRLPYELSALVPAGFDTHFYWAGILGVDYMIVPIFLVFVFMATPKTPSWKR